MRKITFSRKEMDQLSVFECLKRGELTQKQAARKLKVSDRWVRTKYKRYKMHGAEGLLHRNRGKPSSRVWCTKKREMAHKLLQELYPDFGPTFAAEKLQEEHDIIVSRETLRKHMIQWGLWKPKKQRIRHRAWRERRANSGELIQLDGSDHKWFEDRAPKCTLLVFIDDADSSLKHLEFVSGESTHNLMASTYSYIEKHGRPIAYYTDRAGVFKVNNNNPDQKLISQYQRALVELDIDIIHARSPQAKGRVERANGILQDRLVKELRLAGISSVDDANEYVLKHYIPKHNAKFAVQAKNSIDVHRSAQGYDLDAIFSIKASRMVKNDFTIQYQNRLFQLLKDQQAVVRPKERVVVSQQLSGRIILSIRGIDLNYAEILERPKVIVPEKRYKNVTYKPAKNHPWRTGYVPKQQPAVRPA